MKRMRIDDMSIWESIVFTCLGVIFVIVVGVIEQVQKLFKRNQR